MPGLGLRGGIGSSSEEFSVNRRLRSDDVVLRGRLPHGAVAGRGVPSVCLGFCAVMAEFLREEGASCFREAVTDRSMER